MEKWSRLWFALGAVLMGAGVAADAWFAHGLAPTLPPERAAAIASAIDQQYHAALGLMATGLLGLVRPTSGRAGLACGLGFTLSALLFSGALYLRQAIGVEGLSRLAPWGGSLQILSWLFLAAAALRTAFPRHAAGGAGTQI